jgi:hypothetical protein
MKNNKKNILIVGFPNTILRIFIESLLKNYNVFLISYSRKYQYQKLKEMLGKNAFFIEKNSPIDILKLILTTRNILSKNKISTFIAYHNHLIKNGITMLFVKWFYSKIDRIYFPYDISRYGLIKELQYKKFNRISFFFDQICFEKSNKIITKGFEGELQYLKGFYKIHDKQHFVFDTLIEEKDVVYKRNKKLSEKINLVYIGGISNIEKHMNNYQLFKEILKNKRINLHIYSHETELIQDLRGNKNLFVHEYVKDHKKFIEEISKYDFGISVFKPSEIEYLQTKMASGIKMYDYLSAGLPIIIDSEHEAMAKVIKSNNFGIVVPSSKIEELNKYIDLSDYSQLVESVRKNREKYIAKEEKIASFIEGKG